MRVDSGGLGEAMTIKCLEIVLETKIWRENAAKGLNLVSQVTFQAHVAITFLQSLVSKFVVSLV